MFRFAHTEYLYLLLLVPALAFINIIISAQRKKALLKFGKMALLEQLMPDASFVRPIVKFYIMLLAFTVLIFTIAGPQFGTKLETIKRKGIEVIIALDVSNSMNAQDIEPSRLSRAKMAISRLVDKLSNDRIGLIVFAGEAFTQLPITTDYASAKMFLNTINTNIVPVQGTAIGAAINLAAHSFSQQEDVNRAIIVITDGENHEDDAMQAAIAALEKNIKVYTVGMGNPKGSPIPLSGQGNGAFMKDKQGNVVISKLNETMLQEIAAAGNGEYIPANNIKNGIKNLLDELSALEKTELDAKVYTDYEDQFQYLAAIVLFLLFIDFILLDRKNKRLKTIKLFEAPKEK